MKYFPRVRQVTTAIGTGPSIPLGTRYSSAFLTAAEAGAVDDDQTRVIIEKGNDFAVCKVTIADDGDTIVIDEVVISKIGSTIGTDMLELDGSAAHVSFTYSAADMNDVAIALGLRIPTSYLDTDTTLAANSDSKIATQKATKAYVDALLAAQDAMVFKGVIDCSANPNYPAASAGHVYKVSVAGKIGGGSGPNVEIGDTLFCITDGTAAGNHATVGADWVIIQVNIDGAVTGPTSATNLRIAVFDGTTGKLIADGGYTISEIAANATNIAAVIHAAAGKTTPDDSDEFVGADSAASWGLKKFTWANIKAALKATTAQILAGTSTLFMTVAEFWGMGAEVALSGGGTVAATFTNGSTNVGITAHGLAVDAPIHLVTSGSLPTNFTAATEYYVKTVVDANTVELSATRGGSAISAGSAGSGSHTLHKRIWLNFALGINFSKTLTANSTLSKPHNAKSGQVGRARFIQDGTGGWTLAVPTDYKAPGGLSNIVLSTAANADDVIHYDTISTSRVDLAIRKDNKS